MKSGSSVWRIAAAMCVVLGLCFSVVAQNDEAKDKDTFANLKFRNLGPAVAGGRVSAVVGVPGHPNI